MPYSLQNTMVLGPAAVVIGANRHKIPVSPYRSKTGALPVDMVTDKSTAFFQVVVTLPDNVPMNLVDMRVKYVVRQSLFGTEYKEVDCSIVNADRGEIMVYIPETIMGCPGIHLAALQVYNWDSRLIYQSPRYLEIAADYTNLQTPRPVTLAEVRMALRDFPEANTLLNDVEFSDNEIAYCLTKPVDIWNELPPDVGLYDYTSFPWRQAHLKAAVGELLRIAAYRYFRNELPYSSGGMAVNDMNKGPTYLQMAETESQRFMDFCMARKQDLNISNGFTWLPGPSGLL